MYKLCRVEIKLPNSFELHVPHSKEINKNKHRDNNIYPVFYGDFLRWCVQCQALAHFI